MHGANLGKIQKEVRIEWCEPPHFERALGWLKERCNDSGRPILADDDTSGQRHILAELDS